MDHLGAACMEGGKLKTTKMVQACRIVECKHKSDWVSACRELQVEGTKGKGLCINMWNKCVKVDIRMLGIDIGGGF